jgi:DNA-binding transcriptional ArsR family regulator
MTTKGDLAGKRTLSVQVEGGLAYECLMALIVLQEQKGYDYEIGSEWYDNVRTKIGAELLASMQELFAECNHGWQNLLGLAYESAAPKDVPALLAAIEATDPLELRLHLIGYYRRDFRRTTPLDIMLLAAEGDEQAQRQFLHMPFPDECDWQGMLRGVFARSPEETKTLILEILQRWYERFFSEYEQELQPILQRDYEAKRALQAALTPERLIEAATNGLGYVQEPGLRRVLLTPSYVIRPWNEPSTYQDMMIFCYPVADENVAMGNTVPPMRLVRLYKALADERRLRILRLLTARSYTLQELADEFAVAKTTMHYHMATLRTAGLVRIASNDKEYSLRQDMLAGVSNLLESYLKGKT